MGDAVYTQDTDEKAPIGEAQTQTYLEETIVDDDGNVSRESEEETSQQYFYYPLTQDGATFKGQIRFNVRKIEGKDIGSFLGSGIEKLKQFGEEVYNFFTGDEVGVEAANSVLKIILGDDAALTDPERDSIENEKEGINYTQLKQIVFQKIQNSANDVKELVEGAPENQPQVVTNLLNSGTRLGRVTLPLPPDIRIVDQLTYSGEANLGLIGGASEQALATNGAGAITAALKSTAQVANALFVESNTSREISSLVLTGIKNLPFTPDAIGQGASSASRIATNPNIRNLFEKVNLRNFTFTFKMIPTSSRENEMINNMIKFLRINSYPETVSFGGIPVGYIYPNVFDIELLYDDRRVATKFLPTYLRTVTVAYNPTGAGMHQDGGFNEYEVSLDFQEALTLDRDKIQEGY